MMYVIYSRSICIINSTQIFVIISNFLSQQQLLLVADKFCSLNPGHIGQNVGPTLDSNNLMLRWYS